MWRRCPGNHNPVDLPSRGTTATDFYNLFTEWNNGSTLLRQSMNLQPVHISVTNLPISGDNEVLNVVESVSSKDIKNIIGISKYSTADCLFRVAAFIWSFVSSLKLSVQGKESSCSVIYMCDYESHSFRCST